MKKDEITEYVVTSFKPIVLATDKQAIRQCVEEAIRWFDREGADVRFQAFNWGGTPLITLPANVDVVIQVIPNKIVSELFTAQTLLLGVTVLDYDIETLALKFAHLSNLRTFLASNFRWKWVKPDLYLGGMRTGVSAVTVEYLRHYDWTDDDQEMSGGGLDWIIRYATAGVKMKEGRILRMGSVIDTPLDGATLVTEGQTELREIKEELRAVRSILPMLRSV